MSDGTPVRVLVLDPDDIDREGLKCVLREQEGIDVVSEAADVAQAVELAATTPPDVMLVDYDAISEHDLNGEWVAAVPAATRLLVLCREAETERLGHLVEHGVMGIVLKRHAAHTLANAIAKVHAGEPWLGRRTLGRLLGGRLSRVCSESDEAQQHIDRLSAREREVVTLVAQGCRNRPIAARLHISEATVRNHLTSIFRKLQVSDRLELAVFAHRHQLLGTASTPDRLSHAGR